MSAEGPSSTAALSRAILAIALPSMLTNVATALFGMADTWVIGRLGDPVAQGAVEVGSKLLMALLIVFNFLRSSTVALTAQAAGREDEAGQAAALTRGLAVALLVGILLLAAQPLVIRFGLSLFDAKGALADQAHGYVAIRYWGGLAWLLNAVLVGWLIGRRRVRAVLAVEVGSNLFHIALDATLVLGFGLGVAGVAVATLSSETAKLAALVVIAARERPARLALALARDRATWKASELGALFALNRDLFLRTLLLMGSTVLLTRAGAQQGATVLAANAILYQLFMLSALIIDGFESSAQVLSGEALGARNRPRFDHQARLIMAWAVASAVGVALVYLTAGGIIARSFTTSAEVAATVTAYVGWAVALPLAGVASFVFDGVFIGASWTRAMLVSMAAALAVFVALLFATAPLGNHGLWLAFTLFFVARGAGQALMLPGLARRSFAAA
ncbi:MATE family efflux transporter [Phenylobacterium sp.]|uniref:MATE family efflux transporter n=1 Tax=Phenylobacterium sp. TaxID=1871053 RepID=UPI0025F64801|nr:MATE family efflux transporter [Phenylobacterium sp.]